MITPTLSPRVNQRRSADPVWVLGYPVTNVTMEEAVLRFAGLLEQPGLHHVVVVNTNKLWLANRTPGLRELLHRAEMVVTEYGPVWASRVLGTPLKANIRGIGLLRAVLPWLEQHRVPVYLLGARDEVMDQLLRQLEVLHPSLALAGARHGFFEAEDETRIVDEINASGAAVLIVGMGSPRQELFVERHRNQLRPRVAMGVGGSFDVLAGIKRDAPPWMHHGTEWAYRLWQDPGNLWKRYMRAHPWFIYRTFCDKAARMVAAGRKTVG